MSEFLVLTEIRNSTDFSSDLFLGVCPEASQKVNDQVDCSFPWLTFTHQSEIQSCRHKV
jgi:hypothetical protein